MTTLKRKVVTVLRSAFRDVETYLDGPSRTSRLIGIVVSPDFRGVDDAERENRLWAALEESLQPSEFRQLGPIAALTPVEASTLDRFNGTVDRTRRRGRANATSAQRKRTAVGATRRA